MSATTIDGRKADLPRSTPLALTDIERDYAGRHRGRLKRLASLHLHSLLGWPVSMVADLFGHARGSTSRHIEECRRELERRLLDEGVFP